MAFVALLFALFGGLGNSRAEALNVPNGSFESPVTPYVSVNIDCWEKSAKPDWYVEDGGFSWSYNVGLFKNSATNSADYIDNCDGNQCIWLFVVPEVALFQDYDSSDWRSPTPTHAFDSTFEVGKSYQLKVGVIGSGGGMQQGATLQLSLYYRDANSNKVTVAAVSITNTYSVFSNNTHLVDFQVNVPTVRPSDPWAGQHIGAMMLSTVDTNLQGGYWDLDNVRLSSTLEPRLLNPVWTNNQIQFTLQSEPGLGLEFLASNDLTVPVSAWTSLGTLTNFSGTTVVSNATVNSSRRFYTARYLP
jgi:hypothetical protein